MRLNERKDERHTVRMKNFQNGNKPKELIYSL